MVIDRRTLYSAGASPAPWRPSLRARVRRRRTRSRSASTSRRWGVHAGMPLAMENGHVRGGRLNVEVRTGAARGNTPPARVTPAGGRRPVIQLLASSAVRAAQGARIKSPSRASKRQRPTFASFVDRDSEVDAIAELGGMSSSFVRRQPLGALHRTLSSRRARLDGRRWSNPVRRTRRRFCAAPTPSGRAGRPHVHHRLTAIPRPRGAEAVEVHHARRGRPHLPELRPRRPPRRPSPPRRRGACKARRRCSRRPGRPLRRKDIDARGRGHREPQRPDASPSTRTSCASRSAHARPLRHRHTSGQPIGWQSVRRLAPRPRGHGEGRHRGARLESGGLLHQRSRALAARSGRCMARTGAAVSRGGGRPARPAVGKALLPPPRGDVVALGGAFDL